LVLFLGGQQLNYVLGEYEAVPLDWAPAEKHWSVFRDYDIVGEISVIRGEIFGYPGHSYPLDYNEVEEPQQVEECLKAIINYLENR